MSMFSPKELSVSHTRISAGCNLIVGIEGTMPLSCLESLSDARVVAPVVGALILWDEDRFCPGPSREI